MGTASLDRDEHGVLHVHAADDAGMFFGLGAAHARDRPLQMLLMRILGRGEAALHLDPSDEGVKLDRFFRRMGWHRNLEPAGLSRHAREMCESYVAGVNSALRTPWELKLLRYEAPPWTLADSFLMGRMVSYLTLAQSQGEMERLLVELVQAGLTRGRLEALFPGQLDELDETLVARVKLGERIVPEVVRFACAAPRAMASNNWVVAPSRSASGAALLASDPHLEVNRLPAVWQEVVLRAGERWAIAATMPGLPGLIIARTPELAWGPTYSFLDAVDSWIERCDGERYEKDGGWHPFTRREEKILRKDGRAETAVFWENEHGVLDGDPREAELLLSTRWASDTMGAQSIDAMIAMFRAPDVTAGMAELGRLESAFSWVLADREGHIGFQMSGRAPIRREGQTGLVPLPGWDSSNDWRGFHPPEALPRVYDPPEGFFATANQDLNRFGQVAPQNLDQSPHRADRIASLLDRERLGLADMFAIQQDLRSNHAERFMEVLRPLLPDTEGGRALAAWDLRYDPGSVGATHFERFYRALLVEVFGRGLGAEVLSFLWDETGVFADFFQNFDRVLLAPDSAWFGEESRDAIWTRVAKASLEAPAERWGATRSLHLRHLIFGGKLPAWLGFDRGPIELPGGRGTPWQGQMYRAGGRQTSFAPSVRFVTDLAEDAAHTRLMGGPSDRRFSRWYANEIAGWLAGTYKKLAP